MEHATFDPSAQAARNIRRLRKSRGYASAPAFAEHLNTFGFGIGKSAVGEIETADQPPRKGRSPRRLNVDELIVLARALNVSPVSILYPDETVTIDGQAVSPERFAMWWRSVLPLHNITAENRDDLVVFVDGLPAPEREVFVAHPDLLRAWQALARAVAFLVDGETSFARGVLAEAARYVTDADAGVGAAPSDEMFVGMIWADRDPDTGRPRDAAVARWDALRDRELEVLRELEVIARERRLIEDNYRAVKGNS